jgi:hypothetical protein
VVTSSLPVSFGAGCWVAVSPNGKLAFMGNASGSQRFEIGRDCSMSPLGTMADGAAACNARGARPTAPA